MRRQKKLISFVGLILALLIFSLTSGQKPTENINIKPTSTTTPTLIPTSILGATTIPASPSALLESRVTATVVKVVDGDTIQVSINEKRETLRIIGINTPETVDPRRPVECFGKDASNKAKELLSVGKTVQLEQDLSQDNRDRYNRLLRYVFIDGVDYGKQMIAEGYAYEYTYELPYHYQLDYKEAQRLAQENKKGLWAEHACGVTKTVIAPIQQNIVATQPVEKPAQGYSGDLSGDRDCKDFSSQSEAQSYFNAKGGSATNNVDRLDSDGDGEACEGLP